MTFSPGIYASWQKLQKEKFKELKKLLGPLSNDIFNGLVLDVGCGFGYLEKGFRGDFVGVDKDISMLKSSVKIFPRVLADAEHLPFKDESFDTIISIDAMHTISNLDFQRVLKKGGFALLSIFFNDENYLERKEKLQEKAAGMKILLDFELLGREKEYVMAAVKK